MFRISVLLTLILVLTSCSTPQKNEPVMQKQPDSLTKAIDLLKQGKYDDAQFAVFPDIQSDLLEEKGSNDISKGKSQTKQNEINIYRYAHAKLEEMTKPDLALSHLEYMAPIDGVINQQELDNFKAELKKRADNLNSPEERKKSGVKIGMTQDEVLQSIWGKPNKVNKTTTTNGTREQWVYDGGYSYFDNGVLTTIQN